MPPPHVPRPSEAEPKVVGASSELPRTRRQRGVPSRGTWTVPSSRPWSHCPSCLPPLGPSEGPRPPATTGAAGSPAPAPPQPPLVGPPSGCGAKAPWAPPCLCGVSWLCKAQAHPCLGEFWKAASCAASPGLGTRLRSLGVRAEPPWPGPSGRGCMWGPRKSSDLGAKYLCRPGQSSAQARPWPWRATPPDRRTWGDQRGGLCEELSGNRCGWGAAWEHPQQRWSGGGRSLGRQGGREAGSQAEGEGDGVPTPPSRSHLLTLPQGGLASVSHPQGAEDTAL